MKLIEAIRIIEERQKREHKAEKDMRRTAVFERGTNDMGRNIVPVKTYLLQEDIIALKKKTGESSIMGAISRAVDYYLKFGDDK